MQFDNDGPDAIDPPFRCFEDFLLRTFNINLQYIDVVDVVLPHKFVESPSAYKALGGR